MITATGAAPVDNSVLLTTSNSGNPAKSISSFADQLAAAIEQFLGSSDSASQIEIDLSPARSQNSDIRQFMISVKTPTTTAAPTVQATTPATAPAVQAAAPAAAPAVTGLTADGYPEALLFHGALGADTVAAVPPAPVAPKPTSTEAYWALQPPAVQALRTIDDIDARANAAQKLMQQGYTIDYPIMVEGWSPLATMQARQDLGFTWVPSYLQPGITELPGLNYSGVTPYDPNHPPPGSIKVTTDFALGSSDDPTVTSASGTKATKVSAT